MPIGSTFLPVGLLEIMAHTVAENEEPSGWHIDSLTTTNPTFRITTKSGSWILKKSRDPRKEVVAGSIFESFGVISMHPSILQDDWVLMRDFGRYTLENLPRNYYDPSLFSALGRVAADAALIGMRDRKLANIAVIVSPAGINHTPCQIDYEGAFRVGLFNWIFRPERYHRYLATRLLFDVIRRFGEADLPNAASLFLSGFREESDRLASITPHASLGQNMRIKERLIFQGRQRSPDESCKRMQVALRQLLPQPYRRH